MFISPMLLEKREKPFNDSQFVFEPKIDGHRMIISYKKGETRLWTKNNNEVTKLYPELHRVPVDGDVILDGEVCCVDSDGKISFEDMQERFAAKKKHRILAAMIHRPVSFVAFDILFYKGRDLRDLPLIQRKSILSSVLQSNKQYCSVMSIDDQGEDLYKLVCEQNMEGIVAKRKDSRYVSKRTRHWLKVINYSYTDVVISGYRKNEFGILASVEVNGKLQPAGLIEFARSDCREAFYGVKDSFITGEDKKFVYLEPKIKAKVKFRNWYKNGTLRSPSLIQIVI